MLIIENNGPQIRRTNYWDLPPAIHGRMYLSWNAGAARLLVPDNQVGTLVDMETAFEVVISRGPWPARDQADALELLFDDRTAAPFALHLSMGQTDRILPDAEQGGGFVVTAWTRDGHRPYHTWAGRYRRVARLPDLSPWAAQ